MTKVSETEMRQTLAQTIRDLKRDVEQINDVDVAYDLGYIMATCRALGRTQLADRVLSRFERYAF